jgi:drug/metabolite transporter (DMT)-like permease
VSETALRRLSELALIGIALIWGLTFVMVQDAIELFPSMAFLGYRFIPAALLVALIFRRQPLALPRAGWLAGLLMVVFLLCAFSLAAHILATASAVVHFDVGTLLAVQLGVVGVVCLAIGVVAGQLERPEGSTVWSALIVTSLVASALGFFVQSLAQCHAPPARTALILVSEPAFAGLFAWLLNDERLTATGWLGAGLIMTANVPVELVPRFRPPRPLPEA